MKRLLTFFNQMVRHQKKWYAKWHAWTGIFAGFILIIVSLTGTLLVFEEELDVWLYPNLFDFQTKGEKLSLIQAYNKVSHDNPELAFYSIFEYPNRNGCYIMYFKANEKYYQAIINPYTGLVNGARIYQKSVMGFIRHLHRTLLIPKAGKYVVGLASLFMVILMITGLRLWVPKHWNMLKNRLTVKNGAGFKRKNYDWHNSLGFYFSPFITLIAMTGVAITFSNFVILTLFIINFQSPHSIGEIIGKKSIYAENTTPLAFKKILSKASSEMPSAEIRGFIVPRDSAGAFRVDFIEQGFAKTGDYSFALYDQYSGKRLLNTDKDFANTGKLPLNWLTSIHYGTFGGMPTRIIALLASIVAPILFITGFIIWWGRWKKRNNNSEKGSFDNKNLHKIEEQQFALSKE